MIGAVSTERTPGRRASWHLSGTGTGGGCRGTGRCRSGWSVRWSRRRTGPQGARPGRVPPRQAGTARPRARAWRGRSCRDAGCRCQPRSAAGRPGGARRSGAARWTHASGSRRQARRGSPARRGPARPAAARPRGVGRGARATPMVGGVRGVRSAPGQRGQHSSCSADRARADAVPRPGGEVVQDRVRGDLHDPAAAGQAAQEQGVTLLRRCGPATMQTISVPPEARLTHLVSGRRARASAIESALPGVVCSRRNQSTQPSLEPPTTPSTRSPAASLSLR